MARKPAAKHVINRNKQLQLRSKFLHVVSNVCPEVLESLKKQVHPGSLTVEDWAKQFGFSKTWVEVAARETTNLWASHPELITCETWVAPVEVQNVLAWAQPAFKISIPIPDDLAFRRAWFSWDALKEYLRLQIQSNLERELEAFKRRCVVSIRAREEPLPRDLNKKMSVAALHICRRWSPERIADQPGYAGVRSNVFRRIREITRLLDLEPSRRRRQE